MIDIKSFTKDYIENSDELCGIQWYAAQNRIYLDGKPLRAGVAQEILDRYNTVAGMQTPYKQKDVRETMYEIAKKSPYVPGPVGRPAATEANPVSTEGMADWYAKMRFDNRGNVMNKYTNYITFFREYPKYKNPDGTSKFSFNEFTYKSLYDGRPFEDIMIPRMREDMDRELGFCNKNEIIDALVNVATDNKFHPFKDKLKDLIWDGKERMESFFIDFLGAEDTPLNRSMTRKWFYAMMKRLYEPGCQMDSILVVQDETQGTGKTKLLKRLVGSITDENIGVVTMDRCDDLKATVERLNDAWVVIVDEMGAFIKRDPDDIKQFLSQDKDSVRPAYGRYLQHYPRHCVLYGCTNNKYFLKDYSTDGVERRYWIMDAHGEQHDVSWWEEHLPDSYCRQVLAEAKYFYDNNPKFNYIQLSPEEQNELNKVQQGHKTSNEDTSLKYAIARVLNAKYSKPYFVNYEEFAEQAKTRFTTESVMMYTQVGSHQLEMIPCKWIKNLVDEELPGNRHVSTQYITSLVGDEWISDDVYYPGRKETKHCYIRKQSVEK